MAFLVDFLCVRRTESRVGVPLLQQCSCMTSKEQSKVAHFQLAKRPNFFKVSDSVASFKGALRIDLKDSFPLTNLAKKRQLTYILCSSFASLQLTWRVGDAIRDLFTCSTSQ